LDTTVTYGDGLTSIEKNNFYWSKSIVSEVNEINSYTRVYPRIKISSNDLHTSSIVLRYNNASILNPLLENYIDY
jgi:hypothetical protein